MFKNFYLYIMAIKVLLFIYMIFLKLFLALIVAFRPIILNILFFFIVHYFININIIYYLKF